MKTFKKTSKVLLALLLLVMLASACTKSRAKCKRDARKAKKNHIGWQK